ncbi:MAG: NAD(P)-dependent oxidoreductase [Candidatus Vogelbacteria bacterium]|nr:NAD(P)-dependent oxidoreductase [Candidatus Vogelbacteria bacterium]
MKILISGTTGFIGKHLVQELLEEHHSVYAILRPSSKIDTSAKNASQYVFDGDIEKLIAFMKNEKFDGVIHLASLFLAQHKPGDIKELINSNILFSTNLIEATSKSNTPWFINTGTFWQHYKNQNYNPVNLYAATKQAFEDIAKFYVDAFNLNFVTIKLSDTFGPNDTRPKIFNLWSKAIATNETLGMSPGKQKIDINHIENVVGAFLHMATLLQKDTKKALKSKSFAVSSGKIITLRELAKIFSHVTRKLLNINWGEKPYRPREVMIPWNKGEVIPGWKPRISLEEGIRKTFYKQNGE